MLVNIKEITKLMEQKLSAQRFKHSIAVANTAVKLATIYNVNTTSAEIAGLLHDCAKDLKNEELLLKAEKFDIIIKNIWRIEPQLLHGPVGAHLALNYYPELDKNIVNAIYYHTTGRENMSKLEKIIYIADIIEPNRRFAGVTELRNLVGEPLNSLTVKVMDSVLKYLLNNNLIIDTHTIKARNQIYTTLKK